MLRILIGAGFGAVSLARAEPLEDPRRGWLTDRIEDVRVEEGIPGMAAAVWQDGAIVYDEAFGTRNAERGRPVTEDTPFSLASVTKPLTAVGILLLAQRGAVDLDAPVNAYLGEAKVRNSFGDDDEITVRRVLNHTSGLPLYYDLFYADEGRDMPDVAEAIARYGRTTQPGYRSERYSNLGYAVLERIIENVSGKTYARFLSDELFAPLGLESALIATSALLPRGAAQRYMPGAVRVPGYDTPHRGASSAFMTASDLALFGGFLVEAWHGESDLLSEEMARGMVANVTGLDTPDYPGLGIFVGEQAGEVVLQHGGSMAGAKARLRIFPERRLAYGLLLNQQDARTEFLVEEELRATFAPELGNWSQGIEVPEGYEGLWEGSADLTDGRFWPVRLDLRDGRTPSATLGGETFDVMSISGMNGHWWIKLEGGNLDTPEARRIAHRYRIDVTLQDGQLLGGLNADRRPSPDRAGGAYQYPLRLRKAD